MVHKKLAWASAVKIWNRQNAWADDMYALPKKSGQYYQEIVEIIAEHGGTKPIPTPIDVFSPISQKFEAPPEIKILSNSKNMEVPMTDEEKKERLAVFDAYIKKDVAKMNFYKRTLTSTQWENVIVAGRQDFWKLWIVGMDKPYKEWENMMLERIRNYHEYLLQINVLEGW
jgi:hypothetical protein